MSLGETAATLGEETERAATTSAVCKQQAATGHSIHCEQLSESRRWWRSPAETTTTCYHTHQRRGHDTGAVRARTRKPFNSLKKYWGHTWGCVILLFFGRLRFQLEERHESSQRTMSRWCWCKTAARPHAACQSWDVCRTKRKCAAKKRQTRQRGVFSISSTILMIFCGPPLI